MHINKNNFKIALGLKRRIIGVKFLFIEEEYYDFDAGEMNVKMSFCGLAARAMKGEKIKGKCDSFSCQGGPEMLGMKPVPNYVYSGKQFGTFRLYEDVNQDAIAAELTNGNIDFVDVKELKKTEVDELEDEGFVKYSIADNMYQYISFNMRMPIFQDKNLRQAITYAIDRESILANIVEGRGTLINAPFIPEGWASPDSGELNSYEYNVDKAIELLEEAGWKEKDGVRENENGEKLEFTLRCSNDSKTRENAVLYVKECLEKIGIKVEVSIEEDGIIAEDCIYNHNFEMYALNCYFGEDPDPFFWWSSKSASDEPGTPSFNFGSYKNDVVDENIEKGQKTMDQSERKDAYLNVAKQINEDAPMVFYNAPVTDLIRDRFGNTFLLAVVSFLISTVLAVAIGVLSSLYPNSALDHIVTFLSFAGVSVPVFFSDSF